MKLRLNNMEVITFSNAGLETESDDSHNIFDIIFTFSVNDEYTISKTLVLTAGMSAKDIMEKLLRFCLDFFHEYN